MGGVPPAHLIRVIRAGVGEGLWEVDWLAPPLMGGSRGWSPLGGRAVGDGPSVLTMRKNE